jgi:hypothetical protein
MPVSSAASDFGVLTLATAHDHLKAIGLALSLRVSNPGLPVAVACPDSARHLLAPYFDLVITEKPGLRGFVHKVHLDDYTPFERTIFFDSDVLVFKSLIPYVTQWGSPAYTACGSYMTDGVSGFGMDRARVMQKIGASSLVTIDGAGHAYFCAPQSRAVFDTARKITADFQQYAGDIPYADEDVMAIAMTMHELPPADYSDFFSRHLSIKPGTLEMDASRGVCRFIAAHNDLPMSPCMMHFAADEGAFDYTRQLLGLFRKFGVAREGLVLQAVRDLYTTALRNPASRGYRSLRRLVQT